MVSGDVNELIWHFAGYLRLTLEENGATGVVYSGAGTYGVADRAVQRSLLELLRIVSPKSHTAGYSTARLRISDSRLPECLTP